MTKKQLNNFKRPSRMVLEFDYKDGSCQVIEGDADVLNNEFAFLVGVFSDSYFSTVSEIRLYDNAHRLFKRYSQFF